jgi:hypothetical protein
VIIVFEFLAYTFIWATIIATPILCILCARAAEGYFDEKARFDMYMRSRQLAREEAARMNPGPGNVCAHCGQHAWLHYARVISPTASEYDVATWCALCGDKDGPHGDGIDENRPNGQGD